MELIQQKLETLDRLKRVTIGETIDVWSRLPCDGSLTKEEAIALAARIRAANMMYEALALAVLALDGKWSNTDANKYIIEALELANDSSKTLNYQEFQILTEDAIKNLLS